MNGKVWQIQYDIPKVPNARGEMIDIIANPSDELYAARCIRTTGSVWIVLDRDLPRTFLVQNALRAAGCKLYTLLFDLSSAGDLFAMAVDSIRNEVATRLASVEETRRAAEEQLEDESDTDYRRRRRALLAVANRLANRVAATLANIELAARGFGITGDMIGIENAAGAVGIIADNMKARAHAFAVAHGILTRRGGEGATIARQMRTGEMDARIAADWLRDNDEWEAGEAIGGAFGQF